MEYQNTEPLMEVLNNYNLSVKSIKNEAYKEKKGVWWIETDKGLMVLKKISNSEQTFKFIISAVKYLDKNGIFLPSIIQTKDGKDYVNLNNICYVLSEAVKGKCPTYDANLEIIIKELARFHLASKGFSILPNTKPKIHLGRWIDDYTAELEDMNTFYQRELATKDTNAIGKYIISEFPYFYNRGLNAIDKLRGIEYKDWVEKAGLNGALCHQDYAAGNLVLSSTGKLYVLDTDGLTVDVPARDIRKILCKVMKKSGKWDIELMNRIFKYYQAVNPLTSSEWKVLLFDLMYPHLFLGAMNKYYYKRDNEWNEEKYFTRIKEMSSFEKTINTVIENFEAIIPR